MQEADPQDFIGKNIEGYTMIQFIGRGSFATVYRATHDKSGRQVAIKVIPIQKIEFHDCEESFWNELNILLSIQHKNIVNCENLFVTKDNYYIVMQFCNNGDLTQYMIRNGFRHFDEKTAIHFLKQISSAFMALRKNSVVHRDFKLENLFMKDKTIMIGDFGTSTQYKNNSSTYVGTRAYMAPEMEIVSNSGGVYSDKVDLWSIGVAYFKLIFGHMPFGSHKTSINQDIEEKSGKNLRFHLDKNPVSKYSQDLLISLLEKDPAKRISWHDFFNHEIFKCENNLICPESLDCEYTILIDQNTKDEVHQCFEDSKINVNDDSS